jgi:hypothetical protein
MTLLAKARDNRLSAIVARLDRLAAQQPAFRSRRNAPL